MIAKAFLVIMIVMQMMVVMMTLTMMMTTMIFKLVKRSCLHPGQNDS